MVNKVRYGLKNAKYSVYSEQSKIYGSLKPLPGAVSLSLSREGGDSSDFYADDGIYFTFSGTNGGYSGELEVARITDQVRIDLLGEIADSATGVQFETTTAEPPQFALVCEMQGDQYPIGFVFYNCKASRPEMNANTKNESPDVDTDTLNIRIAAQTFIYGDNSVPFVQGHIEKTADNTAKYTAFFASIVTPGASGLSA
jgi:phi13 family phage major tail protein